jgi:hypothetical protein
MTLPQLVGFVLEQHIFRGKFSGPTRQLTPDIVWRRVSGRPEFRGSGVTIGHSLAPVLEFNLPSLDLFRSHILGLKFSSRRLSLNSRMARVDSNRDPSKVSRNPILAGPRHAWLPIFDCWVGWWSSRFSTPTQSHCHSSLSHLFSLWRLPFPTIGRRAAATGSPSAIT